MLPISWQVRSHVYSQSGLERAEEHVCSDAEQAELALFLLLLCQHHPNNTWKHAGINSDRYLTRARRATQHAIWDILINFDTHFQKE
jgi:hypothetical protein